MKKFAGGYFCYYMSMIINYLTFFDFFKHRLKQLYLNISLTVQ